ncbi:MAG: hypothetical protein FJY85_03900 [Deltaproteobacteria bacterium]|nr:hypothetical protein [Deltaproteobacteria bacterium]
MKRGGYSGDKQHELKLRVGPALYQILKTISEGSETAMANVLRELVLKGLGQRQEKPELIPRSQACLSCRK